MPETPDFDQIARRLLAEVLDPDNPQHPANIRAIAEQLRLIWNARGAADLDTIHALGGELNGVEYAALRKLDR